MRASQGVVRLLRAAGWVFLCFGGDVVVVETNLNLEMMIFLLGES